MCFGPSVPDGYGCCYNPQNTRLNFTITAFNMCCDTDSDKFANVLRQSFLDMRDLLASAPQESKLWHTTSHAARLSALTTLWIRVRFLWRSWPACSGCDRLFVLVVVLLDCLPLLCVTVSDCCVRQCQIVCCSCGNVRLSAIVLLLFVCVCFFLSFFFHY